MVLARFERPLQDAFGNLLAGQVRQIRVRRESTGTLARLYSDRDGASPMANPFIVNDAKMAFHVIGGSYRITPIGYEDDELRYVGIGTAQEQDANTFNSQGWQYQVETETVAPPTEGCVRLNNADLSLVTEIYVHKETLNGSDADGNLLGLDPASKTVKNRVAFADQGSGVVMSYDVDSATDSGDYVTLAVSDHDGSSTYSGAALFLQREMSGRNGFDQDDARNFETVAAAASYSPASPPAFTRTAGFAAGGDGGGALYKYAAAEPSHPGKYQDALGNWYELAEQEFTPEMFGAIGDGATDDSGAWQDAIDTIDAIFANGGVIRPLAKDYALASGLVGISNLTVRGPNTTAIWGDGAVLRNTQAGTDPMIRFEGNGTSGILFENILFDGNNKNAACIYGGYGVTPASSGFGTYGLQIINCQFHHCRPAIHAINSFDWVIDRSMFNECGNQSAGTAAVNTTVYTDCCQNFHFLNNFVDVSYGRFIYTTATETIAFYVTNCHVECHSGAGFVHIEGLFTGASIIGNLFWQQPGGSMIKLSATGGRNHILGNEFFNPSRYAVETQGSDDTISNNTSYKNTAVVDHYLAGASSTRARLSNNAVSGSVLSSDGITDSGTDTRLGGVKKGTWTPVLAASGSTFTYAAGGQDGYYEIDESGWATLKARIELAGSGLTLTANALTITGSPVAPTKDITFNFEGWHSLSASLIRVSGRMSASATINVHGLAAGATSSLGAINANSLATGSLLFFTARFPVAV